MSDALAFRCQRCGGLNRVAPARLDAGPKCGRCKAALDLSNPPQDVDDATLQRLVARSPVPVLVDFWAPWCGPCKMVAPQLVELARKHAGRLLVLKVDTDQHQRTAATLQVRGIPTLALWKGGEVQKVQAGAMMGAQLDAYVAPFL